MEIKSVTKDQVVLELTPHPGGAVFVRGFKVNSKGEREALVGEEYDIEVDTEFTFEIKKDGWHNWDILIVDDYNAATAYLTGDIAYEDQTVYVALQNHTNEPLSDADFWEEVDWFDVLDAANAEYELFEKILFPNTTLRDNQTAEKYALGCCGDCEKVEDFIEFASYRVLLNGMVRADATGKYAKGEKMARKSDELQGC